MYKRASETADFCLGLSPPPGVDVVICPPYTSLAMAVASGNPIGLIVSSAAKVGGEVSGISTIEGSAKRTAKEIAEQLKAGAQRQGWIN